MTPRKPRSQTTHHRRVQHEAGKLKKKRRKVKASGIRGYEEPEEIAGYIPDIIATRGDQRLIVEVETPETLASHKNQIEPFRRHATQKPNADFELILTKPRKKK